MPGELPGKETTAITVKGDAGASSGLAVWLYSKGAATGDAAYFSCSDNGPAILSAEPGSYDATVVAGLPEAELDRTDIYSNLDYLSRDGTVLLEDMDESHIPAIGKASVALSEGSSIAIPVTRCAAKVSIEKITNGITKGRYAGKTLTVKSVYIINGKGKITLEGEASEEIGSWFSCSGKYDPGTSGMPDFGQMAVPSLSHVDGSWEISAGNSLVHSFAVITGPNHSTSDTETRMDELRKSSSWTPRKTKIVVEAEIDSKTFYYSIPLDDVSAGNWYRISELTLLHRGSTDPDISVAFADVVIEGQKIAWEEKGISEII